MGVVKMGNVRCETGYCMVEWERVGMVVSMGRSCCHTLKVKVCLS